MQVAVDVRCLLALLIHSTTAARVRHSTSENAKMQFKSKGADDTIALGRAVMF